MGVNSALQVTGPVICGAALEFAMADPEKYRQQAARIRGEAARLTDAVQRQKLLDLAQLFERLADQVEKRKSGQ